MGLQAVAVRAAVTSLSACFPRGSDRGGSRWRAIGRVGFSKSSRTHLSDCWHHECLREVPASRAGEIRTSTAAIETTSFAATRFGTGLFAPAIRMPPRLVPAPGRSWLPRTEAALSLAKDEGHGHDTAGGGDRRGATHADRVCAKEPFREGPGTVTSDSRSWGAVFFGCKFTTRGSFRLTAGQSARLRLCNTCVEISTNPQCSGGQTRTVARGQSAVSALFPRGWPFRGSTPLDRWHALCCLCWRPDRITGPIPPQSHVQRLTFLQLSMRLKIVVMRTPMK